MLEKILVWPQAEVETLAKKTRFAENEFKAHYGPYAIISITGSEDPPANLPESADCVLRLSFDDICDRDEGYTFSFVEKGETRTVTLRQISADQARQVKEFAEVIKDRVNLLLVHCQAGISRSPGTAIAVAEGLGNPVLADNLRRRHPAYNRDVCRRVLEAFGVDREKDLTAAFEREEENGR